MGKKVIIPGADFSAVAIGSTTYSYYKNVVLTQTGNVVTLSFEKVDGEEAGSISWNGGTSIGTSGAGATLTADKTIIVTYTSDAKGNVGTVSKDCTYTAPTICEIPTFKEDSLGKVTIECATAGATIYYTTDGSDPSTSSAVYSSAISVGSAKTIKAIAVKTDLENSPIGSYTSEVQRSITIALTNCTNSSSETSESAVVADGVSFSSKAITADSNYSLDEATIVVKKDGTTITEGYTFADGILTIASASGDYEITIAAKIVAQVIDFTSDTTKAKMVAVSGLDADGDGEINTAEAAAYEGSLPQIGSTTASEADTTITSADWLQYFPKATIPTYMFATCSALTSIKFPDGITEIPQSVCVNCKAITSATIPDSVTKIAGSCFYAGKINGFTIPSGLKSLGEQAFAACPLANTKTLVFPEGFTTIGQKALYQAQITSVTFPSTITEMGKQCLGNCYYLTDIYIKATTPPSVVDALVGDDSILNQVTLHVPASALATYQAHDMFKYFTNMVGDL